MCDPVLSGVVRYGAVQRCGPVQCDVVRVDCDLGRYDMTCDAGSNDITTRVCSCEVGAWFTLSLCVGFRECVWCDMTVMVLCCAACGGTMRRGASHRGEGRRT